LGSAASAREFFERALLANPQHASARSELSRYSESTSSSREAPGQQSSLDSDAAYRKYGPYEFLLQDGSPLSRDTIKVMDALRMRRHPRMSAFLGKLLRRLLVVLGGVLLTVAAPKTGAPDPQKAFETLGLALAAVGTLSALRTVLLISTTRVTIDKGRLQIEKGILARRLTNIELWRVEDIDFRQTLLNRVTGDGILIIHPLPRARGNAKDIVVPGLARGRKLREMHQELLNLTWLLRSSPAVKGVIY
jgi:membrane protein YdbS with pleckstrin-like domain